MSTYVVGFSVADITTGAAYLGKFKNRELTKLTTKKFALIGQSCLWAASILQQCMFAGGNNEIFQIARNVPPIDC